MSVNIFISYDHNDYSWVHNILIPLLNQEGLSPISDDQIPFGENIYRWINEGLVSSNAIMIVMSNNYIMNRSFARAEMEEILFRSIKSDIRVVPVFKEKVNEARIPFAVRTIKSIHSETLNQEIKLLSKELKHNNISDINDMNMLSQNETHSETYSPTERRIRVQISDQCTQRCPWCHWDEFKKNEVSNSSLVLKIMDNLKDRNNIGHSIFPKPNCEFTLTGGEPLIKSRWEEFAKIDPSKTYIITNGKELTQENINIINKLGINKLRIHIPISNLNDYRGIKIRPRSSKKKYYRDIITNINNLLTQTSEKLEVRLNHVLTDDNVYNINSFIKFIKSTFKDSEGFLNKKIKGIAFIEESKIAQSLYNQISYNEEPNQSTKFNIFSVAKKWIEQSDLADNYDELFSEYSRTISIKKDDLTIEFIKLNCELKDDFIKRCYYCVQEQDIGISIGGRIRICKGWDIETLNPKYVFAQFDPNNPLVGISGAIRRKYGIAGFYGHFPAIVSLLNKENFEYLSSNKDYLSFDKASFAIFLRECNISIEPREVISMRYLKKIADKLFDKPSVLCKLFEEGSFGKNELLKTTELCCYLIKKVYSIAVKSDHKKIYSKLEVNCILLILIYLNVDEDLFSSARTIIIKGMTIALIRLISDESSFNESTQESFLINSTYCIGTVAFENCRPHDIYRFIKIQLEESQIKSSPFIQYLIGCIYRQVNSEKKDYTSDAIQSFIGAYDNARKFLSEGSSDEVNLLFKWLYQEILCDSLRSKGAIIKKLNKGEAESLFLKSNHLSLLYHTRLRYNSFFSDAYSSLEKYFNTEFDLTSSQEAYKAYHLFFESINYNNDFYASLVRMGLLELSLGYSDSAITRLKRAKSCFSKRGLLTDQEYLNSLLCDLILAAAKNEENQFDINDIPPIINAGINQCYNVGDKDIKCVINDCKYLEKFLNSKSRVDIHNEGRKRINRDIDSFLESLKLLLKEISKNSDLGKTTEIL